MGRELLHRGPDAHRLEILAYGKRSPGGGPSGAICHQRLAIIDLDSRANQPLSNEDGTVSVAFNGEIYNFRDLRAELTRRGHAFRSNADTEVIVHGYEEYGEGVVERLDGMFAFALWDDRSKRLLLARDRAGKKPLYYAWDGKRLTFASEIKALLACPWVSAEVDWSRLHELLLRGYVSSPHTLHRDILQLPAASWMVLGADRLHEPHRYWRLPLLPTTAARSSTSWDEASEGVRHHLEAAVEKRLVSDVPLGALLSGGVDSSAVVGLMAGLGGKIRTFTAGLVDDPSYDERAYARLVAEHFGTEHLEIEVRADAATLLDTVLWHLDQPLADSSAIPTYAIARATREHVTVALVGDGSDEVFGGYERFRAALAAERLPRSMIDAVGAVARRLPGGADYFSLKTRASRFATSAALPLEQRYEAWTAVMSRDLLDELLRPELPTPAHDLVHDAWRASAGLGTLDRMLAVDFETYLHDDLLVKMDRMSMASSLETRSPFLDTALIEYVATLPAWMKATPLGGKRILRRALKDLLPAPVLRRRKHGFGVPVGKWFRGELVEPFRDLVLAPDARSAEVLCRPTVETLFVDHLAGRAEHGPRLWSLLALEAWLRATQDRHGIAMSPR